MSNSNANKSPDPPLPYPGATPDAERAQKPALPEPPLSLTPRIRRSLNPHISPTLRTRHCPSLRISPSRRTRGSLGLAMSRIRACSRRSRGQSRRRLIDCEHVCDYFEN
jgi:hypothetical protein